MQRHGKTPCWNVFKTIQTVQMHTPTHTMKNRITIAILSLFLFGCVTNKDGSQTVTIGKTAITIPAADVAIANGLYTSAIQTVVTGETSALLSGGTTTQRQIAGSELWSLAANLQGNLGSIAPPSVVSSSSSIALLGNTAAKQLSSTTVTQQLVNGIEAQAAKLVPVKATGS